MKLLSAMLLLAASALGGDVEHSPERTWIRRATLVAGCAASLLFDTLTTQRVAAAGGIEGNRLLSNAQGRPQWGRIVGVKAGLCGVSAILQETHVFGVWKDLPPTGPGPV